MLAKAIGAAGRRLVETSKILGSGIHVADDTATAIIEAGLLAKAAPPFEAFLRMQERIDRLERSLAGRDAGAILKVVNAG